MYQLDTVAEASEFPDRLQGRTAGRLHFAAWIADCQRPGNYTPAAVEASARLATPFDGPRLTSSLNRAAITRASCARWTPSPTSRSSARSRWRSTAIARSASTADRDAHRVSSARRSHSRAAAQRRPLDEQALIPVFLPARARSRPPRRARARQMADKGVRLFKPLELVDERQAGQPSKLFHLMAVPPALPAGLAFPVTHGRCPPEVLSACRCR